MIRVLRVLEYEFETQADYDLQFSSNGNAVPLTGSVAPRKGLVIRSAIFMPTVEADSND